MIIVDNGFMVKSVIVIEERFYMVVRVDVIEIKGIVLKEVIIMFDS